MLKFLVAIVCLVSVCDGGLAKTGIVRPCRLDDLACIAENLQVNSKCSSKVTGELPPEYVVPYFRFEAGAFNASYIDADMIVRNHDKCSVTEFYYNLDRDLCVLSIACPDLNFESNRTMLQHRSGFEDAVFNYHINGTYPLILSTVTMNKAEHIDLCNEYTYTQVPYLPIFTIDPSNRPTANHLSRDLSMLQLFETETFVYKGQLVMGNFVKNYLCDFGCF